MTHEERTIEVFSRVDTAITQLRVIRSRVQKDKHIDPSDIQDLNELIASLRHNCEMHNAERMATS